MELGEYFEAVVGRRKIDVQIARPQLVVHPIADFARQVKEVARYVVSEDYVWWFSVELEGYGVGNQSSVSRSQKCAVR